jgi:hypothetical protein
MLREGLVTTPRSHLPNVPPNLLRSLSRACAIALIGAQVGCLSHEYRVSHDELVRLTEAPPERRGMRVRATQEIGVRRAPALDAEAPPPSPEGGPVYTDRGVHGDWGTQVIVGPIVHVGGGHGPYQGGYPAGRPAPGPVVAQPVGPQTNIAPTAAAGTLGRPAPVPAPTSSGTTLPTPKGGGKGGSSDELVAYAVIGIAIATIAVLGAGLTEGMRFDGDVSVAPGQLIYLQDERGGERGVPIASLTPADLAGAEKAVLRDDEGYGIVRLDRAPLDRQGFSFKVDLGSVSTRVADTNPIGFASHIQFGYFFHQRVGLLAGVSLSGASGAGSFARHAVTLEAQAFPINFWRIHLGGAVQGGSAVAPNASGIGEVWNVPIVGAGGILEVALTTRLSLTARYDWTAARVAAGDWSNARSISAGLAVY